MNKIDNPPCMGVVRRSPTNLYESVGTIYKIFSRGVNTKVSVKYKQLKSNEKMKTVVKFTPIGKIYPLPKISVQLGG